MICQEQQPRKRDLAVQISPNLSRCFRKPLRSLWQISFLLFKNFRQILSFNQNLNKNSSADWSFWNLRGKAIKINDFAFSSNSLKKIPDALESLHVPTSEVTRLIEDYVGENESRCRGLIISGYPRSLTDLWHYLEHGVGRVDGAVLLNWHEDAIQAQIEYGASQGQVDLATARSEWKHFKKNVIPVAEYFDSKQLLYVVSRTGLLYIHMYKYFKRNGTLVNNAQWLKLMPLSCPFLNRIPAFKILSRAQCLKITQNAPFELSYRGILHHFLSF